MESIRKNQIDLRYQRSDAVPSTQAIGIHRAAIGGNPMNPPDQRSIQKEPRTRGGAEAFRNRDYRIKGRPAAPKEAPAAAAREGSQLVTPIPLGFPKRGGLAQIS